MKAGQCRNEMQEDLAVGRGVKNPMESRESPKQYQFPLGQDLERVSKPINVSNPLAYPE